MRKKNRLCASDRAFIAFVTALLTLFFVALIYPLAYVLISSVNGSGSALGASLLPRALSAQGYAAVFEYGAIWTGYRNSLYYMTLGTFISLATTVLCAYPLSRDDCRYGKYAMALCVFTMYFSGGLIPGYLLMRDLRLLDTTWAIVLPSALNVYNMIVMRTYFQTQIPKELLEASYLDGCGDTRYLLRIVLPLSGPILAVIALYVAVGYWNSYFGPMLYLEGRDKLPLPVILREILIINTMDSIEVTTGDIERFAIIQKRKEMMKYSLIVVASLPVMAIYPFVQKYFVKGVMIGAIKG